MLTFHYKTINSEIEMKAVENLINDYLEKNKGSVRFPVRLTLSRNGKNNHLNISLKETGKSLDEIRVEIQLSDPNLILLDVSFANNEYSFLIENKDNLLEPDLRFL